MMESINVVIDDSATDEVTDVDMDVITLDQAPEESQDDCSSKQDSEEISPKSEDVPPNK
ncbi:hypothetical protein A2U01_0098506, partial [Trifolium medium]|nr:hypothetical protein [Trifolium medium]